MSAHDRQAALATLIAYAEAHPSKPTRPLTNDQLAAESYWESIAEGRVDDAAIGLSGRDCDAAADRYYGGGLS